jgi:hypothetical protein
MPGIIYSPSDSIAAAVAGMKRPYEADDVRAVPTYGEPHPKRQKVAHHLHHTQPVQHIVDPISAEISDFGGCKDFFDDQLRRAIAIQLKTAGYEAARPDALEEFRALVESCTASLDLRHAQLRVDSAEGLIARRHEQLSNTGAQVDDQRAANRHGTPRLDIRPRRGGLARLSAS